MATTEEILAQTERLEAEKRAGLDRVVAAVSAVTHNPEGEREPELLALGVAIGDLYDLGRQHDAERIRLRLDIELGVEAIVVRWPSEATCPDQPHAHLRFAVESDLEPPTGSRVN